MPRAKCAPLLRVPCPVLDQLIGPDAAARLSLFQSCRELRDLVLASCTQVQLTLDTQHCALGPAAPHSLQLLAKTQQGVAIRLVLKGAFMCELVPACVTNTFPNLHHLVRPGLLIVQPHAQFTPNPCPQLRILTINTAQLPVTNITKQQMQHQLKALHNLQELCIYIDGQPLPFTPEAITQCRELQRPLSFSDSDEECDSDVDSTYGSDEDSDGDSDLQDDSTSVDSVAVGDVTGLLANMQLSPQHADAHGGVHAAGPSVGNLWGSAGLGVSGGAGGHKLAGFLNSAGMDVGVGMGMNIASNRSGHGGNDSIQVWDRILENGSSDDCSYHPGADSESMAGWGDGDFSDNCTSASVQEITMGLPYFHQEGFDTPWLEGMHFWGSSLKVLKRQLLSLRLQDLTLFENVCSTEWKRLRHLDLSKAFPVPDYYLRLLLDNAPGLTELQVSAFNIEGDYSKEKCNWKHLAVHRYMSVKDLAWLPLYGLQTLRAGPLFVGRVFKNFSGSHLAPTLAARALANLATCSVVRSRTCPSMIWPEQTFAELNYPGDSDFLPVVLPLLHKFEHQHIRMSAPLLLTELGTSLFSVLTHVHTLTITPLDGTYVSSAPELRLKLAALCAQADGPVNLCIHKCIADELGSGWQAALLAAMQQVGHQHVSIKVV